jgi:hypothetical protein
MIFFTSDNGGLSTSEGSPTSNLPLRGGKGWVYEGGIREPWIIRYPGVTKPGSVSSEMICSIDLLPTVASSVGSKFKHKVDGIDLTPAFKGQKLNREALYWHYPHYSNQGGIPGGAIRIGDYKLFENYENGEVSLYNLKKDIGESKTYLPVNPKGLEICETSCMTGTKKWMPNFSNPKENQRTLGDLNNHEEYMVHYYWFLSVFLLNGFWGISQIFFSLSVMIRHPIQLLH